MTNVASSAAAKPATAIETKQFNPAGHGVRVRPGSSGRNAVAVRLFGAPRSDGVTAHKFTIGQIVDLKPNMFRAAAGGQYEVRRLMPASDRDGVNPTYRIKSIDENHERVASEDELTLSDPAQSLLS
jgi:hypothetical protein